MSSPIQICEYRAEGIYGYRKIARALRENVYFRWLSGLQCPDFRTINNFRSGRLKDHIDPTFASLILFLIEEGYVNLKAYFVDSSKFMANTNPLSHIWKKNVDRYQESVQELTRELLPQIEMINKEENRRYCDIDLPVLGEEVELDENRQAAIVSEINEEIHQIK